MKAYRFLIIFFLFTMSRIMANGYYTFRLIDTTNGLPDNEVRAFFTLPDGRWGIRSTTGLSFYDGCEFHTFPLMNDDVCRVNHVSSLPYAYVDACQRVWVKEAGRLFVFDVKKEDYLHDFKQLLLSLGVTESIRDIYIDDAKDSWVVTNTGKLLLSHDGKSRRIYVQTKGLRDICRVGNLAWLVYSDGVLVGVDIKANKVLCSQRLWKGKVLERDFVHFSKSGNHLWLMWSHGVAYACVSTRQWKQVYADAEKTLVTISSDAKGRAYVGIRQGGLLSLDVYGNCSIQKAFPTISGGSIVDDIQTIGVVNDNLVLGLYARGLCLYNTSMEVFPFVPFTDAQLGELGNYQMTSLWGGMALLPYANGLLLFDSTKGSFHPYASQIKDRDFTRSFQDSKGRIWVGTFRRGMYLIDHATVKHFLQGEDAARDVNYDIVRGFAEDYRHRIWVNYQGGIGWVDEQHHRIVPVRHKRLEGVGNINVIAFDKSHDLWAATNDGLFKYSLATQQVYFPNEMVKEPELAAKLKGACRMIYVDSRNLIWVGTLSGLYVLDAKSGEVRCFRKSQGMPNEMIQGIIEDKMGNMWVTTANGLCFFLYKNHNFYLTVFDGQNKLWDSKFLPMALAHGKDGQLLFGCSGGFYVVNPQQNGLARYKGHPILTSLIINNQPILPGKEYEGRVVLDSALSVTKKIVLKYNENFVTFRFSGLNFGMSRHTYYKYRLKGVDGEWVEISPQDGVGVASYTDLHPGTYEFEVHSAGLDKVWSKQMAKLRVVVEPPFYATWWAKTFYVLLFVAILVFGFRWKMEQNRKRMEDEKYKELEEMKYRFFTNISHEFRTLLTLIITPIGSILKRTTDAETRSQLNGVSKNAGDLLQLVNQLLDFRKMEMNGEKLNLASGNLNEFIQYITMKFTPLSEQKNIRLAFEDHSNGIFMYFDRDKVGKILTNLLSNAFKFTKAGGSVRVILEKCIIDSRRYAHIIVEDTGCGISKEAQAHVFERFYRTEQAPSAQQVGSGIGLNMVYEYVKLLQGKVSLESEVGKGSRFIVDIPTDLKHALLKEKALSDSSSASVSSSVDAIDGATEVQTTKKIEKTVLVVEDNDEFRQFLQRELSHIYNKVLVAKDGLAGALMAEAENPDIIVSDVMMPRMNGTDMCRRIKENLQTSHIPVILLTAWSTDEGRTEGYKAGADAYIAKPFDMEVLLARIGNLLEKQEKRQRDFSHSISLDPKTVTDSTPDEKFLNEIIGFIEKNIDNSEYTIDSLAADVVMSRMSLYRKMKSLTGQTPADFIRTVRLKTAAKLLKTEKCNVSEACYRTGFASPQNFTKHFKEMFGVLPSQYS